MNLRLLFAIVLAVAVVAPLRAQNAASHNDQARFLAGLPVRDSALDGFTRGRAWADHATALDDAFDKKERQLNKTRSWARSNLPDAGNSPVYYMFSGPDFLYAYNMFPKAPVYILCGTEPVGSVPDITRVPPEQLEAALGALRQSMSTMLRFHYFITKEMRVDFQRLQLGGTLPVLYVFLARTGCTVQTVEFLNAPAKGVKITFNGAGGLQTLYYFKTDLSNGGGSGGFQRWCANQGPGVSLLKAASYLMHTDGFSGVRNFLLQNSTYIVQDDSGIPLRNFDQRWSLRFFGSYTRPIELFAKHYQPDLAQAYQVSNPPDLGFGFGYEWDPRKSILMLATRR